MPFYETTFENGRVSVACYKDDDEALRAAGEQHRRAKNGEVGGPTGHPAERIVSLRVYPVHPNEWNPGDSLTADELKKVIPDLIGELEDSNGVVSVGVLATEVRNVSHPMNAKAVGHESKFKMEEERVIDADAIEEAAK